jgi:hypothetical protein
MNNSAISRLQFLTAGDRNRISFRAHQISAGIAAGAGHLILVFDLAFFPVAPDILALKIGERVYPFNFTGADGTNPLNLDPYVSGPAAYLTQLAAQLQQHPDFAKACSVKFLYWLTASNIGAIELRSYKSGSDFELNVDSGTTATLNAQSFAAFASNGLFPDNLRMIALSNIVRNYFYNPERIHFDPVYANADIDREQDCATFDFFDFNELCSGFAPFDIPFNPFEPFVSRAYLIFSATNYLLNDSAYLPATNFRSVFFWNAFYNLERPDDLPLGTLSLRAAAERSKVTNQNALEFLSLKIDNTLNSYEVLFTIYYDDATTDTYSYPLSNDQAYVYILPTGWAQNNLGAVQPSKRAYKYVVQVNVFGGPVTDEYTYVLDYRHFEYEKQFIFQHADGSPDTIRLHGSKKSSLKFVRDTIQLATDSDTFSQEVGNFHVVASEYNQEFVFRSGWLMSKAEVDQYKMFLSSLYILEVGEVIPPNITEELSEYWRQNYKKMIVVGDTVELTEEDAGLWSLQFNMRYAYTEKNYTDLPAIPELFYDSEVVVLVSLHDNTGAAESITVSCVAEYFTIEVNGEKDVTSPIAVSAHEVKQITVKAKDLQNLLFTSSNINADISVLKIDSCHIQTFGLSGFYYTANTTGKAFMERIETLYSLRSLDLTNMVDLNADQVLSRCAQLKVDNGFLDNLDLLPLAPSALGSDIKDFLIAQYSMTILTL